MQLFGAARIAGLMFPALESLNPRKKRFRMTDEQRASLAERRKKRKANRINKKRGR